MGRKSKLTEDQWAEVALRLFAGRESQRAIARRFRISESSLRAHTAKAGPASGVPGVAWMLFEAVVAFRLLPPDAQTSARNLAEQMIAIAEV